MDSEQNFLKDQMILPSCLLDSILFQRPSSFKQCLHVSFVVPLLWAQTGVCTPDWYLMLYLGRHTNVTLPPSLFTPHPFPVHIGLEQFMWVVTVLLWARWMNHGNCWDFIELQRDSVCQSPCRMEVIWYPSLLCCTSLLSWCACSLRHSVPRKTCTLHSWPPGYVFHCLLPVHAITAILHHRASASLHCSYLLLLVTNYLIGHFLTTIVFVLYWNLEEER